MSCQINIFNLTINKFTEDSKINLGSKVNKSNSIDIKIANKSLMLNSKSIK